MHSHIKHHRHNYKTEIFYSQKNIKTCKVNKILLHSKYDPDKEALRNIELQSKKYLYNDDTIKRVVVLGCGLGYEIKAAQQKYPNALILAVFYEKTLYKMSIHPNKILYLHEDLKTEIAHKIKDFMVSISFKELVLFPWPPSLKIWPTEITQNIAKIKEILTLSLAEKNTASFFMRQWLVNAVFHYLHIDALHIPTCTIKKDVIVIGAGSTLTRHILQIKKHRNQYILITVSSALMCLYEHNIIPDIVVHQDSAYYSALHLFPLHSHKSDIKIAIPFNTSRHRLFTNNQNVLPSNIILLNSGQDIEALLDCSLEPCIPIGAYGTVMGSALELAWTISSGTVYLAGFDLSIDICGSHCHPHISNNVYSTGTRTNPFENITRLQYTAALPTHVKQKSRYNMPIKQTLALQVYEQWFSNWRHPSKKRTFILAKEKNEHILMGLDSVASLPKTTSSAKQEIINYKKVYRLPYTSRKDILIKKIQRWENAFKCITKQKNVPRHEEKLHMLVRSTFGMINKDNVSTTFKQLYKLFT